MKLSLSLCHFVFVRSCSPEIEWREVRADGFGSGDSETRASPAGSTTTSTRGRAQLTAAEQRCVCVNKEKNEEEIFCSRWHDLKAIM